MKTLLAAGAALAALCAATSAFASPTYNWTGFYVGANGGYAGGDEDWVQTATNFPIPLDHSRETVNPSGAVYGVQAGYNFGTDSSPWVFGVEAQFDGAQANGSDPHVVFPNYGGTTEISWYGTVTGRVGYDIGPALAYVRGGAAFVHTEHFITFNGIDSTDNPDNTRTGWTAGAGVEVPLGRTSNWTARVEFNYMDVGSDNQRFTYNANPPGLIEDWDLDLSETVVTVGVNYIIH